MNRFKLDILANRIDKAFDEALEMAAKEMKNNADKAFKDEGFTDETFTAWKPRKGKARGFLGAAANARSNSDLIRPTLTGRTRKLKHGNKYRKIGMGRYMVYNDVRYAAVHNYGLPIKGHKMPQRRFIGHSAKAQRWALAKIKSRIGTAIRNL